MNKEEYLFQVISEKAAEVTQVVSKILIFGKNNSNSVHEGGTNEDNLLEEFYQMQAIIEYMQRNGILKTLSESGINTKIETMRKTKVLEDE